jgi:outer membrane lipoprotein-sorting protein
MQLTNWVVVDAQGATTRVSLSEIRSGVTIDPQLFVFQDQGSGNNRN